MTTAEPLTASRVARMLEVVQMIQRDVEADVVEVEGKPFTGAVVSPYIGHLAAAISATAKIVEQLLHATLASIEAEGEQVPS